ncbi:hypothetical protein ABK040_010124 [Willaertia magna]
MSARISGVKQFRDKNNNSRFSVTSNTNSNSSGSTSQLSNKDSSLGLKSNTNNSPEGKKSSHEDDDYPALEHEAQMIMKQYLEDDQLKNSDPITHSLEPYMYNKKKIVSPAVLELLEAKKRIITSLWEDSNTNFAHREAFLHTKFDEDAYKNFEEISNETRRLFELRWLDLRIKGLIEQREFSLKKLHSFCLRSDLRFSDPEYVDHKTLEKAIDFELVLFRTLTLYIVEYIETWRSKLTEYDNNSYLYNDIDYRITISHDFISLANTQPLLSNYLRNRDLNTHSPFALPSHPDVYFKYFNRAETPKKQQSLEQSDNSDLPFFMTQNDSDDEYQEDQEDLEAEEQEKEVPFGKIYHFGDDSTLPSFLENSLSSTENKNILEKIHTQMQLPSLLVNQEYSDRMKRHKKYTEPLISIRHEDLLEDLEKSDPVYYKDLMLRDALLVDRDDIYEPPQPKTKAKEKSKRFGDDIKEYGIDLKSTRKVLEKQEKRMKKSENLQRKKFELEQKMTFIQPKFPKPDILKELKRLLIAESYLKDYMENER